MITFFVHVIGIIMFSVWLQPFHQYNIQNNIFFFLILFYAFIIRMNITTTYQEQINILRLSA